MTSLALMCVVVLCCNASADSVRSSDCDTQGVLVAQGAQRQNQTAGSETLERLRADHEALRAELEELRKLILVPQKLTVEPSETVVTISGSPFKGNPTAAVVVVEFSDYQCPYCARHATDVLPKIERDYLSTGRVKYVLLDFPLETVHPDAIRAHEAALCAGEQNRYWEMHDLLLADQRRFTRKGLANIAKRVGLDLRRFGSCVDGHRFQPAVRAIVDAGKEAGATGTPTFFVGVPSLDGRVFAKSIIRGAQPFETFKRVIDDLLRGVSSQHPQDWN